MPDVPARRAGQHCEPASSPDGSGIALAVSEDRTVRLWDARTGQQMLALEGHTGDTLAVEKVGDTLGVLALEIGEQAADVVVGVAALLEAARNLTTFFDEQEHKPEYLLGERDTRFTAQFDAILESEHRSEARLRAGTELGTRRSRTVVCAERRGDHVRPLDGEMTRGAADRK